MEERRADAFPSDVVPIKRTEPRAPLSKQFLSFITTTIMAIL
jgi:hypothetical protein